MSDQNAKKRIRKSRERTNLLKSLEFKTIELLCQVMPRWVKPDMLTALGLVGSLTICLGLILSTGNKWYLLLSIFGFAVQWFGDSLDGRLAYYRNTPRKWYGWSLDINADWISACIIGLGFYIYFPVYKFVAFAFVVAYGGAMILSLLRYKIANKYTIDAFSFGPTELRIIISFFMILEIFWSGALIVFAAVGSILIMGINLYDSYKVLKLGDYRDRLEKNKKARALLESL